MKKINGESAFSHSGEGIQLVKTLRIVEKLKRPSIESFRNLELQDVIEVRYKLHQRFKAGTAEVEVFQVGKFDVTDFDNPIKVEIKLIEGKATHVMKHLQKFSYEELK